VFKRPEPPLWTHETVVMVSDDPIVEKMSKCCDRILNGLSFESTLTLHRKPRSTLTLALWLSHEINAAYPGMPLSEAWGILVDEPNRLGREDRHLRRILSADVAPHPSTLIRIGERLRTAPELQIESSSGLTAALASGYFFDAFGAAGVLYGLTGHVWAALNYLPSMPPRHALAIPRALEPALPAVWGNWLATRRNSRALRPWRTLVEKVEEIPIDGLVLLCHK